MEKGNVSRVWLLKGPKLIKTIDFKPTKLLEAFGTCWSLVICVGALAIYVGELAECVPALAETLKQLVICMGGFAHRISKPAIRSKPLLFKLYTTVGRLSLLGISPKGFKLAVPPEEA